MDKKKSLKKTQRLLVNACKSLPITEANGAKLLTVRITSLCGQQIDLVFLPSEFATLVDGMLENISFILKEESKRGSRLEAN